MEATPPLTTAADLEMRAARVADPGIDLKTKYAVACELREMIDTVRDPESARVLPHMIPVLLEILRSGEPSFQRDSLEFQFRRTLLEILHRMPSGDVIRPQVLALFHGMLHLLRNDNEEIGATCCKTLVDLTRTFRALNEQLLSEFMSILSLLMENVKGLVVEVLSDESPKVDPSTVWPATRSFKVLSEIAMVVVTFLQVTRAVALPVLQGALRPFLDIIALQSPAQQKAREDYEAMGGFWSGMAPTIKNPTVYADHITAQIKMVSAVAFLLRGLDTQDAEGDNLVLSSLRILQDCPPMAITPRKDLMMVFKHLVGTVHRRALLPHMDKLLDEQVLLGSAVASRETLRGPTFACVADLVHHSRNDLSASQLSRICTVFIQHLHNPSLPNTLHTVCAKIIFNSIDALISKETHQGAARILTMLLEASVEKLEMVVSVYTELTGRADKERAATSSPHFDDIVLIEKTRPIVSSCHSAERADETMAELRITFRTLLHGFRLTLMNLKKCDGPVPNGDVILRIFDGGMRAMALYDGEGREATEILEWLGTALLETNLHVFQELWTQKIGFYMECAEKRPVIMHLANVLFIREATSPTLVAIVLRYLIDRLPELGDYDEQRAAVAIRMFKLTFQAVTTYPHTNESILASHLGKLIMDCFPLAAKAAKPTNYFHLLRSLFRAIGGGGGRFELLYKEVLPLLPEMLDCLNRQLLSSDGTTRDLIVELCLTVPLRLTHLLPYLSYLMQPLALALRGTPDLVSQGLRTLELCIDNLTPAFLDPTLNAVLRDVMEALHEHLKPLPANHHHAHTAIRILGKLGGRNRKLLEKDPSFSYRQYAEPVKARFSFGGQVESIELGAVSAVASKLLKNTRSQPHFRVDAFNYIEQCITLILHEGVKGRDREEVFLRCIEGVHDALHLPEVKERAEQLFLELSRALINAEVRRSSSKDVAARRYPGSVFACWLDALSHGLARQNAEELNKEFDLLATLLRELVSLATTGDIPVQDVFPPLNQIASRFTALCLEDGWTLKSAGCRGVRLMTDIPELGVKWVTDREVDLVRTLIHVLKDMPYDLPHDFEAVLDVATRILRVSNQDLQSVGEDDTARYNKLLHLVGIFFAELSSHVAVVRQAAQTCIELLAELSGKGPVELLLPHRDRILSAIYTKPLRALPFPIQIGMIEAVRYCISLQPALPELNEELLRLLHETLALADADDTALVGRSNPRQSGLEIIKLRVACIKLLTASMPLTDFFSKHPQTRQRVTTVYFKSLYSPTPEVKDVAHEGLRMVLTHQSRLPKELLQTGLRPILMNLADPKRLSIPGLEGLARLLELLTNYFKVEIGHKLLDHFRIVADPQMLQASSRLPLLENEGIKKLVCLANIFHLLPSAANIFLENLVNAIVQTESALHFSGASPFSEPLAKYLDRYPVEAMDYFMRHLAFPMQVRTLRSILRAKLAPNVLRELNARTNLLVALCLEGRDPNLALPGLLLCSDLTDLVPGWVTRNEYALQAIVALWKAEPANLDHTTTPPAEVMQKSNIIMSIFMQALDQSMRVDFLFELASIFSRRVPLDLTRIIRFLYRKVALSNNLAYRRNVLLYFLKWFVDPAYTWTHKAHFIQYVITPTLLIHATRSPSKAGLLDNDIVHRIHVNIWQPMDDDSAFSGTDDLFKIELLHLTAAMVQHYPEYMSDTKKDIIKCAWHYISSEDPIVRCTAYLLASHFFDVIDGPQKFVLRVWAGLLKGPHNEGKVLVRQALDVLAQVLLRAPAAEPGYPQWAKMTRRILAEEGVGWAQTSLVYHLVVRQPALFYPVRALFIPHIVNYLTKLGLATSATPETRILSLEILQVIFDWEQKTASADIGEGGWVTPLAFRETIVSYLLRLATNPQDQTSRAVVTPRALAMLRTLVAPTGWSDVSVKLHYFLRALEQTELTDDAAKTQALNSAKVVHVICAEKNDAWYQAHAPILAKLVKRGIFSEEPALQDCLHPAVDRLLHLFPLPKEEGDQQSELSEFHSYLYSSISENLRVADNLRPGAAAQLRGTLLVLKTIVQVAPERIEAFSVSLMKLLSRLAKDHVQSSPSNATFEALVRIITPILEVSHIAVANLGEQRKWLLSTLVVLVDKSKSASLLRYLLDIARDWAMNKRDPHPTNKEKASLLQKMVTFETRGERGEVLFSDYLELIYDIYTDPSLRRTDLTSRLEQPFLLGCRAADPILRERFIGLMDASIPRSLYGRLVYIFGVQSWDALADQHWIYLALSLILGSVDGDCAVSPDRRGAFESSWTNPPFALSRASAFIKPMQRLLYLDRQVAHDTWISVFPAAWACLSRREQADITHHIIGLLSKEYHIKQAEMRPNVIITLLAGVHACSPPVVLPPHLVKYLAKTYGAWHTAAELLESSLHEIREDELTVRDTVYDSLAELYAELAEEDVFYGLWRRRSMYPETNAAMALEQASMWEQASNVYELAQNRTRAGAIPFSEVEFCLWEDHWILAAEKLQQWDILHELAKGENNYELMLESAWRTKDWVEMRETFEEQVSQLPEAATPRRRIFEAFLSLLKTPAALEKNVEFTRLIEDAQQLSIRKWVSLPHHFSAAHVPLLQHFQQFVELQEAVQIFGSLSSTTSQNLERKSSDLKMVLQAWRERLPNVCDDISIWSDLVAWRQNVFNAINKSYIPLISSSSQGGAATGSANTFGYRGYHETAWIINRFAHVARKHELLDVCFTSLNRIYTLPNIEISEAFLKLREQARCHYQKPGDLQAGLEVINNTNLMYFSQSQKAEFYTLKGMFHGRLGRSEEANHAFGQAVQLDMYQAKAWAAWGKYNDRMFKDNPTEIAHAGSAVSCYLQAAGLYKNRKSRPLLTRVLWLLSVDDHTSTVIKAFDTYKGEAAFWYWINLIPQLCLSTSQPERRQARYILLNLAKLFPQALFFPLRTTKEDMSLVKRQAMQAAAARAKATQDQMMVDGSDVKSNGLDGGGLSHSQNSPGKAPGTMPELNVSVPTRQSWELVDEVVQILKTAFPLLILSMETMVEQIAQRFKGTPEEEIYRLTCMLLQDAMGQYIQRMQQDDDGQLNQQTTSTLARLSLNLSGPARKDYEEDFLKKKQTLYEYIRRLQQWRDKYERLLDSRPRVQSLETLSHYLTEFQHAKFDEVEVPGQYTEDKDNNQNFVKIQKFLPKFENCRTHGYCWRRLTIKGQDSSLTSFNVQLPSGRHCRREERAMQLFRTLNSTLARKKESRKRNLHFHIPPAISCAPTLRLLQNDASYINFSDVYDQHCEETGISREDPVLAIGEKVRMTMRESKGRVNRQHEYNNLKRDLIDEVKAKKIPEDVISKFMMRSMDGPSELWRMRKEFALQLAATSFLTYFICLGSRLPVRFHWSRTTGQIFMSEILPGLASQAPYFGSTDTVPFRFTPNFQHVLGPILTEGVLACGIMTIGRCLTEPEGELEQQLCLFARDEVMTWLHQQRKLPSQIDMAFRQNVSASIDGVVKRAETMACKIEREQALQGTAQNITTATPLMQTVINLIGSATNPMNLTKMGEPYVPWF